MYELCNLWANKIDENRYRLWKVLPVSKIQPNIWYDWYDTFTKQFGQCRADAVLDKGYVKWHQRPIRWDDGQRDIIILECLGIFESSSVGKDEENEEAYENDTLPYPIGPGTKEQLFPQSDEKEENK